ncbi:MAG: MBOAT family O-acyltransferase, partial [Candidatus Binatia bacterium]
MTIEFLICLFFILILSIAARRLAWIKGQQTLLLVASYLFYLSWGVEFLFVLIASSLMNYGLGIVLRRRTTATWLWIGIVLNVLLLSFFKYLPPLLEDTATGSWPADFVRHIIMPVGISFWTFQALSYLFDIYREEELDPCLLEFCLYLAFWPTVLAGPVCRLGNMLPQFRQASEINSEDISAGMLRIFQGLFMKMMLAQVIAAGFTPGSGVTAGFDQIKAGWGGLDVWLLGIGFGFQLFFDFAGYSNIVIGAARLFGIRLDENFDRPFFSLTPSAFWTRWHMSLSFWIRDYVFLPLATMRRNAWWPYVVFVLSMALFGLWHEAKATFVLWGIYHGLLLVAHRLGQQIKRRMPIASPRRWGALLSWGGTFLFVSLGWIFFRARDLEQALTMFRSVFTPDRYRQFALPASFYLLIFLLVSGYFISHATASVFTSWRARYKERLINHAETLARMRPLENFTSVSVIAVELVEFFAQRMWWWLTPTMAVVAIFIG